MRKEAAKEEATRLRASTLRLFIKDHYEPWAGKRLRTSEFQIKRIKSDFESWLDRHRAQLITALA